MSKIESRPSRRRPWEYVFFVDIDGHESDQPVAAALADVRASCETLKVLGSYPARRTVARRRRPRGVKSQNVQRVTSPR